MVALVIGLVSVLATTQLFLISEGQKRTITGGGNARVNGAFALYRLQRDIRQGGYGVSAFNLLGCKVTLRTGVDLSEMAPVSINPKLSDHTTPAIPEGDANTDTLLVVYGDGNGASEGNGIVSATSPNSRYRRQPLFPKRSGHSPASVSTRPLRPFARHRQRCLCFHG